MKRRVSKKVVIFDSECMLCNRSLNVLIKLDRHKVLRYTSLNGEHIKDLGIPKELDSIIFSEDGTLYYKSTAILKILRSLGGIWVLVNVFYLIPKVVRDVVYDAIAKYRYNIFGKMDACRRPQESEAELFID